MKEKLNTLPVAELRKIAKENHIVLSAGMKKADIIEAILRFFEA